MKRIVLAIIIIVLMMLVGCSNEAKHIPTNVPLSSQSIIPTNSSTSSQSSGPTNIPPSQSSSPTKSTSNYVKTYMDEYHKQILFGKLSFNIGVFHITSHKRIDNTETFKCEIDKGETRPETHMTIKVREIEKKDFPDTKSIVSYLSDMSPNYEKILIYNDVTDESGIVSLYIVSKGNLTNYLVCFRDVCYLIESDYSILEVYLFKNNPAANYEVNKLKIECANSFTTNVNETIFHNKNEFKKTKYEIIQGIDGTKYSAELSFDSKEYMNNFTLNNEKGENLLTLSTEASGFNKDIAIKFLDVNKDGYADVQFLKEEGTMNNSYEIYVWDNSAKNFIKVKCDERLSHFEVHDGYLINWQKAEVNSGVKQKLIWKNKNTLIKESEENYHVD